MAFIFLVARAVKCGRRLCGKERARDVLNPVVQQCRGFKVEPLAATSRAPHETLYTRPHGQQTQDAYEELLRDNRQTPVPDLVGAIR